MAAKNDMDHSQNNLSYNSAPQNVEYPRSPVSIHSILDVSELNAPVPACCPHYPSPPLRSARHSCSVPTDHVYHSHCLSKPEGQVKKVIKYNN